jgi:hypothetical protein
MKRIANILTGLSFAVLFLVASAHAQFEQRMTANVPFEFVVGTNTLPAGQYEFLRTGDGIYLVRDADGRSLFTMASGAIQSNGLSEKSVLKFITVNGRHVLAQIWNDRAETGNEFLYGQTYVDLSKQPTVHVAVDGRR